METLGPSLAAHTSYHEEPEMTSEWKSYLETSAPPAVGKRSRTPTTPYPHKQYPSKRDSPFATPRTSAHDTPHAYHPSKPVSPVRSQAPTPEDPTLRGQQSHWERRGVTNLDRTRYFSSPSPPTAGPTLDAPPTSRPHPTPHPNLRRSPRPAPRWSRSRDLPDDPLGPVDPDLSRDQDPTPPHQPQSHDDPDDALEYLSSPEDPTSPALPGALRRILADLASRFPITEH